MELICLAHSECLSISAGLPAPAEMVTNHANMSVRSVHQIVFVHAKGEVKEKKKIHLSNLQMIHSLVTKRGCFVFGLCFVCLVFFPGTGTRFQRLPAAFTLSSLLWFVDSSRYLPVIRPSPHLHYSLLN